MVMSSLEAVKAEGIVGQFEVECISEIPNLPNLED